MKIKALIYIAFAAALTLSFTFISVKPEKKAVEVKPATKIGEPVGGFLLQDEF